MEATAKALGIDRLSLEDRLSLIEEIWDGLVEEVDLLSIPASHAAELDRRLAARAENPGAGTTWQEVMSRLTAAKDHP